MVTKKPSTTATSNTTGRGKSAEPADRVPENAPRGPRRKSAGKRSEVKDAHDRYAN